MEGVLADKPVDVLIDTMGEYAMNVRVSWWIVSYRDTRLMYDRVYTAILHALQTAGIEIPTGTYDINILKVPKAVNDENGIDQIERPGSAG